MNGTSTMVVSLQVEKINPVPYPRTLKEIYYRFTYVVTVVYVLIVMYRKRKNSGGIM